MKKLLDKKQCGGTACIKLLKAKCGKKLKKCESGEKLAKLPKELSGHEVNPDKLGGSRYIKAYKARCGAKVRKCEEGMDIETNKDLRKPKSKPRPKPLIKSKQQETKIDSTAHISTLNMNKQLLENFQNKLKSRLSEHLNSNKSSKQ